MVGVKGEIETGTLGISCFSEVFASLVSVPGQRPEFGFSPGLHAESTADGADVSSDQPPLWTREKKIDSGVAVDTPSTLHLCPEPFQHHRKHLLATAPDLSHLASFPQSIAAALLC